MFLTGMSPFYDEVRLRCLDHLNIRLAAPRRAACQDAAFDIPRLGEEFTQDVVIDGDLRFGVNTDQAIRTLIERDYCRGDRNRKRDNALRRSVKFKRSTC
ncbi:MAG TPA: hypothetical protein VK403_04810 [Allosphingosinicella sp.]|nr:hypothetical protein [Allosphingosinicella sp.]